MTATISGLYIFPVKSLAGVALKQANVTPAGIEGDRQWMLVDGKGRFISQREIPKMATINTAFDGDNLTLYYPGMDSVNVRLITTPESNIEEFQIWKDTVEGYVERAQVNNWLTNVLGEFRGSGLRLVRFNNKSQRKVGTKYLEKQESNLKLADACPFLITCEASLATLNARLAQRMPMDRFRANIVLTGTESFEEYKWQQLKSDNSQSEKLNFAMIGPCQRCPMTSIDQDKGVIATPGQPLQTLMNDFPVGEKKLPFFGQHAHLPGKESGALTVGDILTPVYC